MNVYVPCRAAALCLLALGSAQALERRDAPFVEQPRLPLGAPPAAPPSPATPGARTDANPDAAPSPSAINPAPAPFTVAPADQNFRRTLARWAQASGWTFEPEHWALSRDIPVSASASFDADFKSSVRRLLNASAQGDLAVQPCFYSNRVLRVIALTESCALRTTTPNTTPTTPPSAALTPAPAALPALLSGNASTP